MIGLSTPNLFWSSSRIQMQYYLKMVSSNSNRISPGNVVTTDMKQEREWIQKNEYSSISYVQEHIRKLPALSLSVW